MGEKRGEGKMDRMAGQGGWLHQKMGSGRNQPPVVVVVVVVGQWSRVAGFRNRPGRAKDLMLGGLRKGGTAVVVGAQILASFGRGGVGRGRKKDGRRIAL